MQSTQWLPIPGYEGLYEASDDGRVRSVLPHPKGRTPARHVLAQSVHSNGYANVGLRNASGRKVIGVHRLVALAFHGAPNPGDEACHIDGNKLNNHARNLRWGTHAENVGDTVAAGNHFSFGRTLTHCKRGHEFTPENTYRNAGRRSCRACRNNAARTRRKDTWETER